MAYINPPLTRVNFLMKQTIYNDDVIFNKIMNANKKNHHFLKNTIDEFKAFIPTNIEKLILDENEQDVVYTNTMKCDHCGFNIPVTIQGNNVIIEDKCSFPLQDLEVEVDFSSGKIVNAEYLVNIAEHINQKKDFGYDRTYHHAFLQLQHFAKNQIFFPSIPNGEPSLYLKDGVYHLVEGSDSCVEDVVSWNELNPLQERLGCFFIDYDKAKKMQAAFEILELDFDDIDSFNVIEIPKGIYKCKVFKEANTNSRNIENTTFAVGTMTKI